MAASSTPRGSKLLVKRKKKPVTLRKVQPENDVESDCNMQWASVMSNLLVVKPPKVDPKCPILASIPPENGMSTVSNAGKKKPSFTVVGEDDRPVDITSMENEEPEERSRKRDRRDWEQMGKVKPDIADKEHERTLSRIATRGVMHLFNAVQARQKAIESKLKEVGTSEFKKEKVLKSMTKGDFLDILKNNTANVGAGDRKPESQVEQPKWKLLHDDFTTGSKMKDWDIKSASSESD